MKRGNPRQRAERRQKRKELIRAAKVRVCEEDPWNREMEIEEKEEKHPEDREIEIENKEGD
jgi:hypothetical protein